MRIKTEGFVNLKGFREFAVKVKKGFFRGWEYLVDEKGRRLLFTERQAIARIAEIERENGKD